MIGWKPTIPFGKGVMKYRDQLRAMHGRRGNR
jgi:hypothetical protein